MTLFNEMGPFRDGLTMEERGRAAKRLTEAARHEPAAEPARRALGDLGLPENRAAALACLNGLHPQKARAILSRFEAICRRSVK